MKRILVAALIVLLIVLVSFLLLRNHSKRSSAVTTSINKSRATTSIPEQRVIPNAKIAFTEYRKTPIFADQNFDFPMYVLKHDIGSFSVLDRGNNRLAFFDKSMKFIRQVGQIGQVLGDFYTPADYFVDKQSRIYVLDLGNSRVQILDRNAEPAGMFPLNARSLILDVNSRGEILLNQPSKGSLLSVYSQDGTLLRQFGELMTLSHAYPGHADDDSYQLQLSRARTVIDEKDNIYVCYRFAPILQKYDNTGNLLWEAKLVGEDIDSLVRSFWEDPKSVYSEKIDGIQMAVICAGFAKDDTSGRLYVLLGNCALYITDESGNAVQIAHDVERGRTLTTVKIRGQSIYVTDISSCYEISLAGADIAVNKTSTEGGTK